MFNNCQEILSSDLGENVETAEGDLSSAGDNLLGPESRVEENSSCLHKPVMVKEIIEYLQLRPGQLFVDATIGTAGHSLSILERITPGGKLIGIDRDEDSLSVARGRLKAFSQNLELIHGNFTDIDLVLEKIGLNKIDGILFDLGISSYQLGSPLRGFSFQEDGPLDMRMDRSSYIAAYDLLNNLNEDEISEMLWAFGQERWHRRIARAIVYQRQKKPVTTTTELVQLVLRSIPARYRSAYHRIHPATRTFQAIRIAVNRELEAIDKAIDKAIELMRPKARICVISFHSLEDRIIKLKFKKFASEGMLDIITPKPLSPSDSEIENNPASRSAKLRVAERL